MGLMAGLPIAVQLVSDITQARMRAASSVVASVADAVNAHAGAMTQFAAAYTYPFVPPTAQRRTDDPFVRVNPTVPRGMRITIVEGDENYIAHVEMPNVAPEDISVKVGDRIEVRGGSATAYCALPNDAHREAITAEYRDSILTLRIPKEAKRARREVRVKVSPEVASKA
jgi:HSP20 family molecular chaperone IbpA